MISITASVSPAPLPHLSIITIITTDRGKKKGKKKEGGGCERCTGCPPAVRLPAVLTVSLRTSFLLLPLLRKGREGKKKEKGRKEGAERTNDRSASTSPHWQFCLLFFFLLLTQEKRKGKRRKKKKEKKRGKRRRKKARSDENDR